MRAVFAPIVGVLLLAVAGTTSCHTTGAGTGPPIVQPGAPGEPSRMITAIRAVDLSRVQHTATDVRFMQGMIGHHAQALDMTALVPTRSSREDMQMFALRIKLSQEDEIKMMEDWLEVRGEEIPGVRDHHESGGTLMPGMLTAKEINRLREATGAVFDRLFLESMIKHHEGALIMVDELLSTAGAGQETIIAAFASDVVADQRAEMDRMSAMLIAMLKEQQP
ncbi:MAG: DUF305 domain-containing protein [Chloroflexi bacterium]|nr:DUF305 domain-containing protein [Chloroflexota bacterium]